MEYKILETINNLIVQCEDIAITEGRTRTIINNSIEHTGKGLVDIAKGGYHLARGLAVPAIVASPFAAAYAAGKERGSDQTLNAASELASEKTNRILSNAANTFMGKYPIGTAAAVGLGAGAIGHHYLTRTKKEDPGARFTPSPPVFS